MESFSIFLDWMTTPAATNWITLAGFILAVFAFLYQGHATRKQLALQNFANYTKRYEDIFLHLPEVVADADFSLASITTEEVKSNIMRYMRAYFDLCSEELVLYKRGYIDKATWHTWKSGMKAAFARESSRQIWAIISKETYFSPAFRTFVDDIMTDSK